MKRTFLLTLLALILAGCNAKPVYTPPSSQTKAEEVRKPESRWYVQAPKINPIDGTKEQFLSLSSNETGFHTEAEIVLSFHNGRMIHSPYIGFRVDVKGFVPEGEHTVRTRFDGDTKPTTDTWDAVGSHDALYPHYQKEWLQALKDHKTLAVEFSRYQEAPTSVSFDLTGLADVMKREGLQ